MCRTPWFISQGLPWFQKEAKSVQTLMKPLINMYADELKGVKSLPKSRKRKAPTAPALDASGGGEEETAGEGEGAEQKEQKEHNGEMDDEESLGVKAEEGN